MIQEQNEDAMVQEPAIRRLSPELWDAIFDRAFLPLYMIHHFDSHIVHPNSLAGRHLEQQRRIVTVCRAWHRAGTRLLYENIFIRRPTQIPLLLRSLKENPQLGPLIRGFRLGCVVPTRLTGSTFPQTIQLVIDRCPRLTALEFTTISDGLMTHRTILAPIVRNQGSPITSFTMHYTKVHGTISPTYDIGLNNLLSSMSSTLVHLSLGLGEPNFQFLSDTCAIPIPSSLSFPCVESLTLIHPWSFTNLRNIVTWKLPSLRNFTIQVPSRSDLFNCIPVNAIPDLLKAHGQHLQYLHLQPTSNGDQYPVGGSQIQPMLDCCPALKHLIVHSHIAWPIAHPTVEWLDVWNVAREPAPGYLKPLNEMQETFPSLRATRQLSMSLVLITDLPNQIPPRLDPHGNLDDGFELQFLNFHLVYRDGVIRNEGFNAPWPDEDEDEDSSYDSTDDFSSSEGSTEGSDSDEDEDDDRSGEKEAMVADSSWDVDEEEPRLPVS
ncbi:hypothetical protein CC2G_008713 [Coprinopsis cinerea AmutBmut pab1-1]|nr:hypothetical protein CC2G_008713 [Coprinopsis cinerea AmutBmut pab1-1]